jgi:hypothetical protein
MRTYEQLAKENDARANSNERKKSWQDFNTQAGDMFDPGSDTNYTEMEYFDVEGLSNGNNVSQHFRNMLDNKTLTADTQLKLKTVDDKFGYSYSTDNESE